MSLIAEVELPISVFCLGRVADIDTLELELEPFIPTAVSEGCTVWVRGELASEYGERAKAIPEVSEITMLETVPDGALYEVVVDHEENPLLSAFSAFDITLLACSSTGESWTLELRLRSHTALRELRARCVTEQIDMDVTRLVTLEEYETPIERRLTDGQREALLLALDHGYFDDRRRTSLAELGTELGISRQAVAARLRRAYRCLAEAVSDETPNEERIT
ncbi:helix-turn-helix domain-containing protein [Haloferax namakaokahaiae]|uniref:Helix-turn-helix domain-containing protein n=1 Tax=Haloferax namakaokahaiae TaxID=1748331 RepID=A0ABD5ZGH7_9EURY